MKASLTLEKNPFKNNVLSKGWYDGDQPINEINFVKCEIVIIEADVFNMVVFKQLETISFISNINILNFDTGSFRSLSEIIGFYIYCSRIGTVENGFLQNISNNMKTLYLSYFIGNIGFREIFGYMPYRNLCSLSIANSQSTQFATLAATNFTVFSVIETIFLTNCGIEHISSGTFDYIGQTLQRISLENNKLKQITPAWFRFIFERNTLRSEEVHLSIRKNPIVCNCEFYFLRIIYFLNRDAYEKPEFDIRKNCDKQTNAYMTKCPNIQHLHTKKLCLKNEFVTFYKKFKIKFLASLDALMIQTNVTESIRVLVIPIESKQKCPSSFCVKLPATYTNIPRTMFPKSSIIKISILYFIQGWPLSTITIRLAKNCFNWEIIVIWLLVIALYSSAVLLGVAISVSKAMWKLKKDKVKVKLYVNNNHIIEFEN